MCSGQHLFVLYNRSCDLMQLFQKYARNSIADSGKSIQSRQHTLPGIPPSFLHCSHTHYSKCACSDSYHLYCISFLVSCSKHNDVLTNPAWCLSCPYSQSFPICKSPYHRPTASDHLELSAGWDNWVNTAFHIPLGAPYSIECLVRVIPVVPYRAGGVCDTIWPTATCSDHSRRQCRVRCSPSYR